MTRFQPLYFVATIALLLTEVLIALFVHDKFIRPYIGDTLVVMLLYCFVQSFFKLPVIPTALAVLAFSYLVETLQYFKIIKLLGLQHSKVAKIIIGTSFAWADIIAYTIGIILVILVEKGKSKLAKNVIA